MNKKEMQDLAGMIAIAIATAMSQPAATVTNAVVSAAKTGQRYIKRAVKDTVKANRVRNGGPLPNLVPAWQLIDDCLCDANGNPIADAQAPKQHTATKKAEMTKRDSDDLARLQRKGILQ